jgi:hypothetical protein
VSVIKVVVFIDDDDDDDGAGGRGDSIDKTIQRVEHCTALHCTALHCTALHYIALSHSTRHSVRISG